MRLARSQLRSFKVVARDPQNVQGMRSPNFVGPPKLGSQSIGNNPQRSMIRYIPKKKKSLALMAISLFPSKFFSKNLFLPFVKVKEKREHSFLFLAFLSFNFCFSYLFIPPLLIPFFSLFFNGARKHQTPWRLCWLLLPLMHRDSSSSPSFLSRFTPRYDILNCMSGTENGRPQKKRKQNPKTPKRMGEPFLGWTEITEVMIQYDDHTARRTR